MYLGQWETRFHNLDSIKRYGGHWVKKHIYNSKFNDLYWQNCKFIPLNYEDRQPVNRI